MATCREPSRWISPAADRGVDLRNWLRQRRRLCCCDQGGASLVVFLIDVGKGPGGAAGESVGLNDWVVLAGLAALAGHIWPVWLGWKGGKAVATGLGMFLGLAWPVGLACFGLFMAVISIFRIVSLSSEAAISLPVLVALSAAAAPMWWCRLCQPDGALAPSQQHRAAAGGHRTQDRAESQRLI